MGLTPVANYKFYWTKDSKFRMHGIPEVMPRDCFLSVKRFIYFHDHEETASSKDRLAKLKTVYDAVSKACRQFWVATPKLSIDESMIAFTEVHSGKGDMPQKPIQNGFKMFVLADSDGYAIKFFPSFGRGKEKKKRDGKIEKVDSVRDIVLDLLGTDFNNKGYHVFMDRYIF